MEGLKPRTDKALEQVYLRISEKKLLQMRLDEMLSKRGLVQEEIQLVADARRLLELFSKSTVYKISGYIEPVVTEALEFVFNQKLKFHIVFVSRRNQIEVDFVVLRDDEIEALFQKYIADQTKYADELEQLVKETKNLTYLYGGSVNQVLACVLRLVLVELFKIQGPVLLDEPSGMMNETHNARLGQLIVSLSQRFHRQVVVITHSQTLASYAEKVYHVEQSNSVSSVREGA